MNEVSKRLVKVEPKQRQSAPHWGVAILGHEKSYDCNQQAWNLKVTIMVAIEIFVV